ncbi:site-specific integrase [Streptomyces sp. CS131]|uniref:tyrosine-type recombinase/integrase n=1 Tax=Streptomyces sp. CS131 TaxID=2162711 RepID=UPI000D52056C|nr:site-specific integrase [Streptomyces sp. CS131]PVC79355.1 integrase [Streptomyces sp. CS131]
MPYDRWHKSHPKAGEPACREHRKVPTADHGVGKRWQARWRNREGIQQTELFRTEAEARRHETKMLSGVDDGSYIDPRAGEVRVSELALTWLKGHEHKNPRTYRRHKERVQLHIIPTAVGKMRVKDVKPSSLLNWLHDRRRLLESSTLRLVFDNLRAIFDLAVDDSLIPKNPCLAKSVQDAKPKRGDGGRAELTLSWEDTEKIRAELPDRYKALVDCGRGLGLRQGEIFALSPEDIDWTHPDGPMVHVQRQVVHDGSFLAYALPKGGDDDDPKDRWVELTNDVAIPLREHMEKYPPVEVTRPWGHKGGDPVTVQLIFYTREKTAIQSNWFNSYRWKPALAAVGLIKPLELDAKGRRWEKSRDKMMHALRHLYASMMINGGVDVYTLADRLGHADPAFTLRKYVHRVVGAGSKIRIAVRSAYTRAA